ncbi:MAG TPA: TlpA disulfide reductase family protein [Steroidobacteraceae bacterium]|nr:TlpA disulfide reductase family protein [Steroidobacteraceae bacterium]
MKKQVRLLSAAALFTLLCGASASNNTNESAPDFSRADLNGKTVHLADYRGKLVLLNFWATWCAPCREEMPQFSEWQREYGAKGLQVIGVSMDDDAAPVKEFIAQRPVTYPILMGDAKLGESFGGVLGLPTSYLIDPQGRIVTRYRGESNLKKMEAEIKSLLSRMNH